MKTEKELKTIRQDLKDYIDWLNSDKDNWCYEYYLETRGKLELLDEILRSEAKEPVVGGRYKYKEHNGYIVILSVRGNRVAYRSEEDECFYTINKEQFFDFFVMEHTSCVI